MVLAIICCLCIDENVYSECTINLQTFLLRSTFTVQFDLFPQKIYVVEKSGMPLTSIRYMLVIKFMAPPFLHSHSGRQQSGWLNLPTGSTYPGLPYRSYPARVLIFYVPTLN